MADILFIAFLIYLPIAFIRESIRLHNSDYVSTGDIHRYHKKKAALNVKYDSMVPKRDKLGNRYTAMRQCMNKVGRYSKEYHDELKDLENITFRRHTTKLLTKD